MFLGGVMHIYIPAIDAKCVNSDNHKGEKEARGESNETLSVIYLQLNTGRRLLYAVCSFYV